MTLDEAVDTAFRMRTDLSLEADTEAVRDLISDECDRLVQLPTWEAKFARSILEPMVDELYRPQLENASVA